MLIKRIFYTKHLSIAIESYFDYCPRDCATFFQSPICCASSMGPATTDCGRAHFSTYCPWFSRGKLVGACAFAGVNLPRERGQQAWKPGKNAQLHFEILTYFEIEVLRNCFWAIDLWHFRQKKVAYLQRLRYNISCERHFFDELKKRCKRRC